MPTKIWSPVREYGLALFVVVITTAISFAVFSRFDLINLVMLYLLGTLIVATRGHRGPAALSSALGVLAFDFFFVPPRFSLSVHDAEYVFTFIVMFIVAMIISHLTIRLRSEAAAAREGERRTLLMHEFSQGLTKARDAQGIFSTAVPPIEKTFDGAVTIFGPRNGRVEAAAATEKEQGVAQWVFDKAEPAGLGADSLPSEPALYIPLKGSTGVAGVLRLRPVSDEPLSNDRRKLLDAFGHQIALALEVEEAKTEIEAESLRNSLLSSVSHDFRTPLTAIVGSASALLGRDEIKKSPIATELAEAIQEEGGRLTRQIQNLLEVTRLESGVRLNKEIFPLEEIMGTALDRLSKILGNRTVTVNVAENAATVPVDGLLLEQVFVNLLENTARHTPASATISINAEKTDDTVTVSVADNGPGFKHGEVERVFDKFYHGPSSKGVGLGLAICRGIVTAHGGRIWAENAPNGGAVFRFTLPLEHP